MNTSHLDQRRAKVFTVAELAYDSIKEALFHLETMKPLIADRRILDALDKTYPANTRLTCFFGDQGRRLELPADE